MLDKFLETIPDEPNVSGQEYTPSAISQISGKPSNSLIDQIRSVDSGGYFLGG